MVVVWKPIWGGAGYFLVYGTIFFFLKKDPWEQIVPKLVSWEPKFCQNFRQLSLMRKMITIFEKWLNASRHGKRYVCEVTCSKESLYLTYLVCKIIVFRTNFPWSWYNKEPNVAKIGSLRSGKFQITKKKEKKEKKKTKGGGKKKKRKKERTKLIWKQSKVHFSFDEAVEFVWSLLYTSQNTHFTSACCVHIHTYKHGTSTKISHLCALELLASWRANGLKERERWALERRRSWKKTLPWRLYISVPPSITLSSLGAENK